MGNVIDLNQFKKEKEDDNIEEVIEDENGIREIPEEEFQDFLEYDMKLDFENHQIYNDKFIQENAEHIVNNTIPHCVVCKSRLSEGDKVDTMWPLEYGGNICGQCESKLNDSFNDEKIVNLTDLKLILIEEDFKKIMEELNDKEIQNINGFKIITEKKYQEIKYKVLNVKEEEFFRLP